MAHLEMHCIGGNSINRNMCFSEHAHPHTIPNDRHLIILNAHMLLKNYRKEKHKYLPYSHFYFSFDPT